MTDAESSQPIERSRDDRIDEVEETFYHRQMGVKVERVIRAGMEENERLLKVYANRRELYGTLDGEGTEEVEQYAKVGEFSPQVATEVLFGLAEAHGYELEEK
jgi:hypothetical protein